jgi:hypothetical protein
MTQALQKAYLPAVIEAQEIPGIAVTERKLDTVAVSTLLTVFDWNLSHRRFHSVKNFIGGLITALLSSSLSTAAGPRSEIDLRWAKSPTTPIKSLLGDTSIDISFPWEGADCDRPNDLIQASAVLCDNAFLRIHFCRLLSGFSRCPTVHSSSTPMRVSSANRSVSPAIVTCLPSIPMAATGWRRRESSWSGRAHF